MPRCQTNNLQKSPILAKELLPSITPTQIQQWPNNCPNHPSILIQQMPQYLPKYSLYLIPIPPKMPHRFPKITLIVYHWCFFAAPKLFRTFSFIPTFSFCLLTAQLSPCCHPNVFWATLFQFQPPTVGNWPSKPPEHSSKLSVVQLSKNYPHQYWYPLEVAQWFSGFEILFR